MNCTAKQGQGSCFTVCGFWRWIQSKLHSPLVPSFNEIHDKGIVEKMVKQTLRSFQRELDEIGTIIEASR